MREGDNCIFSAALYYGERTLRNVESQCIGGMGGVGPNKLSQINVFYMRAAHISELRTLTRFGRVARDNAIRNC